MKKLKLSIEKPCSSTRENFYPVGTGYFCTLCEKEVTDYSYYSKSELAENFKNNSNPGCGIFRNDQLNKNILPSPSNEFKLSSLILSGLLLTTELCLAQSGITDSLKVDSLPTKSFDLLTGDTISLIPEIDINQTNGISIKTTSKRTRTKLILIGDYNIIPQMTAGFVQCSPQPEAPIPPFAVLSDTINPLDTTGPTVTIIENPVLPPSKDPADKKDNTPHLDIFAEERKETNIESEDE